jgi:hypothetical protein
MLGCLLATSVAACGDAAVDGEYRGEALFTLTGKVALDLGAVTTTDSGELRAALFWAKPSGSADADIFDSVTSVEQELGAASTFPARYTLTIRRPPPASLIGTAADVHGRFAVALVLVYLDLNGDARWDHATESLVGSAPDSFVLYAPEGLSGGRYGPVRPGFHLLVEAVEGHPCENAPLQGDAQNLLLIVDMRYPGHALADINCDGGSTEWTGACPTLDHIAGECRAPVAVSEPEMCAACDGLLWPLGADRAACDAWRASCTHIADAHECEEAWEKCVDPTCETGDDHCG